ncbi:hypothetical protein B0T26DRAFT_293996 [Lasiosphaeria miniovina]|uniref:Uncharacterized protein n=1 Tax=Lasiosphaeria miniovina TaxID=1954250 RepID=A0AA40DVN4_9PEZI|nr:uncharacterized protein B0T26DRAFT_293996 [Lasiosphaeria miniovina]KAK0717320.1 hypothetical protein B0T26DRAFT_293996 [Lasiosphaeria miniovina]
MLGGPSGRTRWLVTFPVCSGRRLLFLFETQNGPLICQVDLSVRGTEQVARTTLPFIVVSRFRGFLLLSSPRAASLQEISKDRSLGRSTADPKDLSVCGLPVTSHPSPRQGNDPIQSEPAPGLGGSLENSFSFFFCWQTWNFPFIHPFIRPSVQPANSIGPEQSRTDETDRIGSAPPMMQREAAGNLARTPCHLLRRNSTTE